MNIKEWINSILLGMASMADPLGTLPVRNMSKSDEESILSDWQTVGDDLRKAMQEMDRIDTRGCN